MRDPDYLDWPFFEAHHKQWAQDLWTFATENLADIHPADERDDGQFDTCCRDLVSKLGQAGFLDRSVVTSPDGAFDVRALALARDVLARVNGLADFAYAMQGLGTGPISLFGTAEQRGRYLPAVRQGKRIAAFALSEKAAGSDVSALATRATRDGDGYVIEGEKTWISNGGLADQYVVFARTADTGAKGLSAFIVEADNPGLRIAERIQVIAPHPLATLAFDTCRVPAEAMIGAEGEGFKIAMATLDIFRSTVGAAGLGFARRALDEALARVQERHVFGRSLADFQLTQAKLADMAVAVDAAALLVYRAAWTRDAVKDRVTREAAMAKLHATESAQAVIDQAVQLFGGLGVVSGRTVESLYREIRALRIYEGTSEIQKLIIAGSLLKEPAR